MPFGEDDPYAAIVSRRRQPAPVNDYGPAEDDDPYATIVSQRHPLANRPKTTPFKADPVDPRPTPTGALGRMARSVGDFFRVGPPKPEPSWEDQHSDDLTGLFAGVKPKKPVALSERIYNSVSRPISAVLDWSPLPEDIGQQYEDLAATVLNREMDPKALRGEALSHSDYLKQFGAGAGHGYLDTLRSVGTLGGMASMAAGAPELAGLGRTGQAISALARVAGGHIAIEGGKTALDPEQSWGHRALGAFNAAMGTLQAAHGIPEAARPKTQPSWGTPENPPARVQPAAGPPPPPPVAPPAAAEPLPAPAGPRPAFRSPEAVAARNDLARRYAAAEAAGDEAAMAAIEKEQAAPIVSRPEGWANPAAAKPLATPPAGPDPFAAAAADDQLAAVLAPRQEPPQPAGPAGAAAAPPVAETPAGGFTPADIADMKKAGIPDATIAQWQARAGARIAPPKAKTTVIQPEAAIADLPPLAERMAADKARRTEEAASRQETAPPVNETGAQQPVLNGGPSDLEIGRRGAAAIASPPAANRPGALEELLRLVKREEGKTAEELHANLDAPENVDDMTGLMNKRGWEKSGDGKQAPGRVKGVVDIDNFKTHVNDVMGHEAGDRAIKIVGDELAKLGRRKGDRIARTGGDEFELDLEAHESPAAAAAHGEQIEQAVNAKLREAGFPENVGISLGWGDTNAAADAAMYARKAQRGVSKPRKTAADPFAPVPNVRSAHENSVPPSTLVDPLAPVDAPPAPGVASQGAGQQPLPGRPPERTGPPDAPEPALVPRGGGDRPPAPRAEALPPELEDHFSTVLADARQHGFTGTDAELRAHYEDRVASSREFVEEMRGIRAEHGDEGLLKEIRRLGGIKPYTHDLTQGPKQRLRGDFESIVSNFKSTHGQAGASSVFRNNGLGIDDLLTQLQQGGRFPHITDEKALLEELNRISRAPEMDAHFMDPAVRDVLEGAHGVKPGERWWEDAGDDSFDTAAMDAEGQPPQTLEDLLDTGEVQPRLPGDVGAVRTSDKSTPEFDAPFSLTREVAEGPKGKQDSLAALFDKPVDEPAAQPAAAEPPAPKIPGNLRSFLTKRLGFTDAEVDAMGPEAAAALGEKVKNHPEGVQAGIKAYAKPKAEPAPVPAPGAEPTAPSEPLPDFSQEPPDPLLTMVRRGTALNKTRVEKGLGATEPPKLTPAQMERTRTLAAESQAARAEAAGGRPPKMSQSEVSKAGRAIEADAAHREKLIANPTPENIDEYIRTMDVVGERQARRDAKKGLTFNSETGVAAEPKPLRKTASGEYLASGLGGFEKMYQERPDLFWQTVRMAGGGLIGAIAGGETDDEDSTRGAILGGLAGAFAGAKGGALLRTLAAKAPGATKALKEMLPEKMGGAPAWPKTGVSPVRGPRDMSKDIGGLEALVLGQPHRTVPDVWRDISPILDDMATAEKDLPGTATPRLIDFTRSMYVKEAAETIGAAARDSKEAGHHLRAKYLDAMRGEMLSKPTGLEKFGADLTKGTANLTPKQVAKGFNLAERAIYVKLLGFALDSAIINRTQVALAVPHIGWKGVWEGLKAGRTAEGKAATRHLNAEAPTDAPAAPGLPKAKASLIRKVVKTALSPMRMSDTKNRKDVFLGAMYHARKQGLTPEQAHEWAMEVTAQTQGTPGELGANPFHRQLGPLRMFTKYPAIWGQWFADIASHPDPAVRRRGVGMMLGVGAVGAAAGVNVLPILFPRMGLSSPALKGAKDVLSHVPGQTLVDPADHGLGEDLDPRTAFRYPAKVAKEATDVSRYGLGEHPEFDKSGNPRGEHSAWTGFLSLLGVDTTAKTAAADARNKAFDFTADATRKRAIESRENRGDLRDAIERGDRAAAADIARKMSPQQVRDFYRRNGKSPYQLMLERVPVKDRPEFERRFRGTIPGP